MRLCVRGGDDWDARISGRRLSLVPARDTGEPDAMIGADPATWMRIAGDVRAGMRAFQRGSLRDARLAAPWRGLPRRHQRRHASPAG